MPSKNILKCNKQFIFIQHFQFKSFVYMSRFIYVSANGLQLILQPISTVIICHKVDMDFPFSRINRSITHF